MTHICVMSSHKSIRIYMGGLILCTGFSASLGCFLWLGGKGLRARACREVTGKGYHIREGYYIIFSGVIFQSECEQDVDS